MAAQFRRDRREDGWRSYVADQLMLAPQGRYIARRWGEQPVVDGRTAEEIAEYVIETGDLEVVGE